MRVAIVDADGIGRYLPAALGRLGLESIHVRSDAPNPQLARRPDILVQLHHGGDLAATTAALRSYDVGFVVAGTESGVLLADALSQSLGTPGNGMSRPLARRDKYEMARAVRDAGLRAAPTIATADLAELLAWRERLGEWPVVLKPPASAGTDNVLFCHTAAEIAAGFTTIMGALDRYDRHNTAVVAQAYLHGEEFFVNTVSRDGAHHVVEVWRYSKRMIDGHPMYDYEEPVPPAEPAVAIVADYVLAVLDALEIRNGAAHTEVILTADGPVLVESAARCGGSHEPDIVSGCLGTDQIECLALAIAAPQDLIDGRLPSYRPRTRLRYVTLISPSGGQVPSAERLASLRALPSFLDVVLTAPEGAALRPTVDLGSSPGYVYLSSPDPAEIDADYRRLRALEATGLYGPAALSPSHSS